MPRKASVGTELVALRGVVVDHVEDHLDVRLVQRLHHRLELLHLLATLAAGGVGVVRREEADRVVAPVVRQPLVDQRGVLHELVHRHQLDRGDAEILEVRDRGRVGDAGVRAADLLGYVGMGHRQTLDVRLVDHRLVVLVLGVPVAAPVEERGDDHRQHVVAQAVLVVEGLALVELVGEQRLVAVHLPVDGLGVGVEQQLRRVAAVPLLRRVRVRARGSRSAGPAGCPGRYAWCTKASVSTISTRVSVPSSAIRHSSTLSATSEKSAKLTPAPSYVAPRGYGRPGQICMQLPLLARVAPRVA